MTNKSVRISNIALEFNMREAWIRNLLEGCWGNFMTLRKVLTNHDDIYKTASACGISLREIWIAGNESTLVDKLTLCAISTIARNAEEADKILEIILGNSD